MDQTGTSRYDLLEDFHDISNTDPDKSPGHMNWYPFGQTFVDPIVLAAPVAISGGKLALIGGATVVAAVFAYLASREVELHPGRGINIGGEVSDEEAARIVAGGGDVIAESRGRARRIAEMAGGGRAPTWEGPHRPGERPHYHPTPRTGGHVFYNALPASPWSNRRIGGP